MCWGSCFLEGHNTSTFYLRRWHMMTWWKWVGTHMYALSSRAPYRYMSKVPSPHPVSCTNLCRCCQKPGMLGNEIHDSESCSIAVKRNSVRRMLWNFSIPVIFSFPFWIHSLSGNRGFSMRSSCSILSVSGVSTKCLNTSPLSDKLIGQNRKFII